MSTASSPSVDDYRIAFACIALSLVGLASLVAFAARVEPLDREFISLVDEGRFVRFHGVASRVSDSNGNYFIELCNEDSCVKCVVFAGLVRESKTNFDSLEGARIAFSGVVREYSGAAELVALNADAVEFE